MKDILGAIKEVFGFLTGITDPTKRKAAYELHLDKRRNKALDYAENYIMVAEEALFLLRSLLPDDLDKIDKKEIRQDKRELDRLQKAFFKYN